MKTTAVRIGIMVMTLATTTPGLLGAQANRQAASTAVAVTIAPAATNESAASASGQSVTTAPGVLDLASVPVVVERTPRPVPQLPGGEPRPTIEHAPVSSQFCVSRTVVSRGMMVFVVHGVGRAAGGACLPATQHTRFITDCLRQTAGRMTGTTATSTISTAPLQDCLQRRLPGSAVGGGVLGSNSRGSVGLLFTDHTGSYGGSPTCGGSVDPRRSSGGWFRNVILPAYDNYSKATDAVDYAEKGVVGFAAAKTIVDRNRYLEQVLQESGGSDGVYAQESEAAEQVKRSAATATSLANENLGIPEGEEKGLWETVKSWVSSLLSKDDKSTDEAGETRTDPRAENPCNAVASFIAACAQAPRTGPCQLFFTRLRNPRCNALVALTDEGRPCAGREYSEAEVRTAVQRAEVKCWSLIRPTPDGGGSVCGLRLPEGGSAFLAVPDAAGSACSSPVSLTTEDQCTPRFRSPAEVAADLLPDRYSVLDLLLGMQGGLPPLPAGPRPR
jgi:hypothetical protein